MELKVWVDGIKRVVCGVTDNTTCQDIVIALAQAMGRTGRFTLIEKWRENERPLAPGECPLIVLQKWGEFANEVKLMLYESGTRRKQKQSEKEKEAQKPQETYKHNFTPPVKTSEAVIRRSLTFNGPVRRVENGPFRVQDMQSYPRHSDRNGTSGQPERQFLRVPDNVTDMNSYRSSNSSISSQNSNIPPQQQHQQQHVRRRSRSSSRDRGGLRDQLQPPSYDVSAHQHSGTLRGRQPSHQNHHQNHHQSHQFPQHQQSQSYLPKDQQHNTYPASYNSNTSEGQGLNNQSSYNKHPQPHPVNVQNRQQYPSHHGQHGSNSPSMNGPGPVTNEPLRPGQYRLSPANSNSSPVTVPSAFKLVKPRLESPANEKERGNHSHLQNNTDIPVYTDVRQSSHQVNSMEEYDLDSNFPDVVKETGREFLIEEYHVPGQEGKGRIRGNQKQWEEEERIKLLRLVTMQNERIKMQDSQLDIIDTEIVSREQKIEDLKSEINRVSEEITKLSNLSQEKDQELSKLDNGTLIDEMETEKATERDIKNEITSLHSRLEKCENDLKQFQSKVHQCSNNLEKEQEVLKSDEKRRKEEEIKLQNEISELRKEVDKRTKESEEKSKVYSNVEDELKDISERLSEKTSELTSTEKELQRENLKFFQHAPTAPPEGESTKQEANGDAVLKVLEGSSSAHVKRAKLLASPLTILELTKQKNGVWV